MYRNEREEPIVTNFNINYDNTNSRTATLYVGDLHPDVTEPILLEKFSSAGSVVSIQIARDLSTGRPLGYAFVKFQHSEDAEKALCTMNFDILMGRSMRIMLSHQDSTLRNSGVGNIVLKNLDESINNKALRDAFSIFGNILSLKIATDEEGNSKGFGFVQFETEESANNAIATANGMVLNGKIVYAEKFIPLNERKKTFGDKQSCFTNLYVKNFDDNMDQDKLRKIFEKYGAITSAKVMTGEDSKSKGFGFVSFEDSVSAQNAVDELNGKELDGKQLYVGRAQRKEERENELKQRFDQLRKEDRREYQAVNLYIKNLDEAIDDGRLREEFSPFGTITSAKVMRDSDNCSRGFGFVCFSSPEEAAKAIVEMNGRTILSKPLYVALAQRKEERRAYLSMLHRKRIQNMLKQHFGFQWDRADRFIPTTPVGTERSAHTVDGINVMISEILKQQTPAFRSI